jgi:hypothetical protein
MKVEQEYEEYSSYAWVNLDDVQFIDDPVIGSQITSSDPTTIPLRRWLRQAGHIEYSFTTQETKYLTTENTCVIDNLVQVGVYGKELKINKDTIIKLNKEFYGIVDDNEPEYIEDDFWWNDY